MSYKLFIYLILIYIPNFLFAQNVFRILDTERGYPLWNQARNNDGTCTPSYNDKFPNSGNHHCDCDNFWAGCGANAMGQIMWYWQCPKNYNWEIIPPELHENTPWNSAEQLQQFILDCATSINTHYTTCLGSWATANNIEDAFKNTFNYKSATLFKKDDHWSDKGWKNLIKTELDARRLALIRGGRVKCDFNI